MSEIASGKPVRVFGLMMAVWLTVRIVSVNSDTNLVDNSEVERLTKKGEALVAPASRVLATSRAFVVPDAIAAEMQVLAPEKAFRDRVASYAASTKAPFFNQILKPERSSYTLPSPVEVHSDLSDTTPVPATSPPAGSPPSLLVTMAPVTKERADRWRGSMWALWREGSSTRADAVMGGRLGGSQAGLRIDFDLTPEAESRVAAYSRMSVALNRPASPEAAAGVAWQPSRSIPISLAAERRIALGKGARNANAVMAVGGFGPKGIAASLQAEGYAQTGMVGFRSNDLFMDGKLSVLSPVAHFPVRVGASVSGGAQPQVERLDVGPEVQIRLPLPRAAARLSVEWRERIAGLAAPASGLAITLGGDF